MSPDFHSKWQINFLVNKEIQKDAFIWNFT